MKQQVKNYKPYRASLKSFTVIGVLLLPIVIMAFGLKADPGIADSKPLLVKRTALHLSKRSNRFIRF
jgi:hypothetical protein